MEIAVSIMLIVAGMQLYVLRFYMILSNTANLKKQDGTAAQSVINPDADDDLSCGNQLK